MHRRRERGIPRPPTIEQAEGEISQEGHTEESQEEKKALIGQGEGKGT